ncbi:MAG: GTPase [Nanoarchaeota archaeon]
MRVRYSFSSRKTGTIEGGNKHTQPVPQVVRDAVRISDIVIEVLDARYLAETRHAEFESIVSEMGKKLLYVVNKIDLADVTLVRNELEKLGIRSYVLVSCASGQGRAELRERLKIEAKRLKRKGSVHVGVIGLPNTGKSTLINFIVGRHAARASQQAGFTKGIQKLHFSGNIYVIDSPGVLPGNRGFASEKLIKESTLGTRTYDSVKEPFMLVVELMRKHKGIFEKHYGIDAAGDSAILLETLGMKLRFLKKGGVVNLERAARAVLKDWQSGKIKV